MFATRVLLTIAVFCFGSALGEKQVCDFEDSSCLTKTAGLTFVDFIKGTGSVPSSDPLHADLIDVNLPTIVYKLFDSNLSGFKQCKVTLVKISPKDLKFDYNIGCPHLTLVSGYELKGDLGPTYVEGKGNCQIDFYDYHFLFHGDYISKEKNGKVHINLKNHKLSIEAKGKVHYDFKNLYNGDQQKSDDLHTKINQDWQSVDTPTRQPAMEQFMNIYINNVNAYLDVVSVQDLFSYDK